MQDESNDRYLDGLANKIRPSNENVNPFIIRVRWLFTTLIEIRNNSIYFFFLSLSLSSKYFQ